MVVVTGLSGEIRIYQSCFFGCPDFKTTDNECQIFRLGAESIFLMLIRVRHLFYHSVHHPVCLSPQFHEHGLALQHDYLI